MRLFVIGSSNMDLVIRLPRIPMAGETILGGNSAMIFGGKGANQAVAAKRAGADLGFISKLGKDVYGGRMKDHFMKEGLPAESLLEDDHLPSGIAQIWVSDSGENAIAVASGANANLLPQDLRPFEEQMKNCEYVLMQLETPLETITYVTELSLKFGFKVILNPAPAALLSDTVLKRIWLLSPNEYEAGILSGIPVTDEKSAEKAGQVLLSKGVQNVIITLGAKGSVWCSSQCTRAFQTPKVKAKDTTAAGDVFNGALAAALTSGQSLEKAIPFASVAAAISVTRDGAQPSIPYKNEIDSFNQTNA